MRIKVLFDNKRGSVSLEKHLDLIKDLIQRYPNALWRKIRGNHTEGYELEV